MNIHTIEELLQTIMCSDNLYIYGAGEYSALLIKYLSYKKLLSNVRNIVVTQKDTVTPLHLMGVKVIALDQFEITLNAEVLIAVLSENAAKSIQIALKKRGCTKIILLDQKVFEELNRVVGDYSAHLLNLSHTIIRQTNILSEYLTTTVNLLEEIERHIEEIDRKYDELQYLPLVIETHKKSFKGYKDKFKGKTVVLCGNGPSLQDYSLEDDYIHIGANAAAFYEKIADKLDYYFVQDIPHPYDVYGNNFRNNPELREKYLKYIQRLKCVKFIGQMTSISWRRPAPYGLFDTNDYNFYYINGTGRTKEYMPDLRYDFVSAENGVLFAMFHFALFCGASKIYIVGSDGFSVTGNNYFNKQESEEYITRMKNGSEFDLDRNNNKISRELSEQMTHINNYKLEKELRRFKEIVDFRYPETAVVMVNPKLFKGIFKETVTDEKGRIVE